MSEMRTTTHTMSKMSQKLLKKLMKAVSSKSSIPTSSSNNPDNNNMDSSRQDNSNRVHNFSVDPYAKVENYRIATPRLQNKPRTIVPQ